jgi:lysozyme
VAQANSVVDLSHHNVGVDLAAAKADGIAGVIHKATQGTAFTDPTYDVNRQKAASAGLRWGAYHFGTGADGVVQAELFLNVVQPGPETLLVLDFEANGQGASMSLEEARAFVTHVHGAAGRWPGLYSGHYVKDLLGTGTDPVLRRCWFWLSQYGPTAVVPSNWASWTFWQYTDGAVGPQPHVVKGIGRCDRDRFNGDDDLLREFWTATHRTEYA